MVGVRGKYKGCETCRLRRVKCDNQRPFCRKCLNGGRLCAGYQRETVFIVGTIQDQGRCSSHPPRVLKTKTKTKPKTERKEKTAAPKSDDALALVPTEPLRPVWDDGGDGGGGGSVSVSCRGRVCRLRIAALRTNLQATTTTNARGDRGAADDGGGGKSVFVSLPPYEPPDLQPGGSEDDFRLTSRCFVHLAEPDGNGDGDGDRNGDRGSDGVCLFLYEHNNSVQHSGLPPWRDPAAQTNAVRRMGPESFRSFPNHHFFVRVYRPNAVFAALLNRAPTFLAAPEWTSTPWERHAKSALDRLLDRLAVLPALLSRADRVLARPRSAAARRLMAQDLLHNVLDVERGLAAWSSSLFPPSSPTAAPDPDPDADPDVPAAEEEPFSLTSFSFSFSSSGPRPPCLNTNNLNPQTALPLLHYWAALVLAHPTFRSLHCAAVLDPVPDSVPVPARQQTLSPQRYAPQRTRQLAGRVCGALQALLSSFSTDAASATTTSATTTTTVFEDDGDYDNDSKARASARARGGGQGCWAQPADMLWFPLAVVRRFYEGLRAEEMEMKTGTGTWDPVGAEDTFSGGGELGTADMGMGMGMGFGTGMDMDMDMGMGMDMGVEMEMGMGMGDGRLGVMWCDEFGERLAAREREMREAVQARRWVELAGF